MEMLRLDLERLGVDSFTPETGGPALAGTVRGNHAAYCPACLGNPCCCSCSPTCGATCPGSCQTCPHLWTCYDTCETCVSCRDTCRPRHCAALEPPYPES